MDTTTPPRFEVRTISFSDFTYWQVIDTTSDRIVAQSFNEQDARFVCVKLNQPCIENPKAEARHAH